VVQAIVVEGVAQRLHHVFLAHQLAEQLGPPFSGKYLVRHKQIRQT
jgi:hypothetical protein